jgi:hypothetical protein
MVDLDCRLRIGRGQLPGMVVFGVVFRCQYMYSSFSVYSVDARVLSSPTFPSSNLRLFL